MVSINSREIPSGRQERSRTKVDLVKELGHVQLIFRGTRVRTGFFSSFGYLCGSGLDEVDRQIGVGRIGRDYFCRFMFAIYCVVGRRLRKKKSDPIESIVLDSPKKKLIEAGDFLIRERAKMGGFAMQQNTLEISHFCRRRITGNEDSDNGKRYNRKEFRK